MGFPSELKYTKTHEWAKRDGGQIVIGLTDYAQKEISDVVFVELPKIGQDVVKDQTMTVVESVKAAFDIYAPVSGKIVKTNSSLESNPALVNQDCYHEGWLVVIEMANGSEWDSLLSADTYGRHIQQEAK